MSPKLKKGLLIGGGVLGAVVICVVSLVIYGFIRGGSALTGSQAQNERFVNAPGMGAASGGAAAEEAPMPSDGVFAGETAPSYDSSGTDTSTIVDQAAQQQVERLIIRNGSISLSVDDTISAQAAIEGIVNGLAAQGAFIVSSNEYGGTSGKPYISMNIRVPADQFDSVMNQIEDMATQGTTPSVSTSAQDVTSQYVDLQARLESLQAARDRLLQLMQNADTTEDLLMAEQQLTQREAEIESLKGQMQYLSESAQLSAISIDLTPYILSQPVDTRWRPAETVREAFDALLNGMRDFGDFLIFFAIAILPFLIIFGLVIFGIVRFIIWRVRVGQRKRAARMPAPTAMEEE